MLSANLDGCLVQGAVRLHANPQRHLEGYPEGDQEAGGRILPLQHRVEGAREASGPATHRQDQLALRRPAERQRPAGVGRRPHRRCGYCRTAEVLQERQGARPQPLPVRRQDVRDRGLARLLLANLPRASQLA